MSALESLRDKLPEAAKDLKLNLQAILRPENLTQDQVWGCVLASAFFLGDEALTLALVEEGRANGVTEELIDDARAAASIMGMNAVYYRFRHLVEKESYNAIPPRLRMMRMSQLKTDKATFELMSMSCAALAGCGMCLKAHDATLVQHGITEAGVNDSIRIAAVLNGVKIALSIPA